MHLVAPFVLLCTACGGADPVVSARPARGYVPPTAAGAAGSGPIMVEVSRESVAAGGNPNQNTTLLPPPAPAATMDGTCNQDVDIMFVLDVSGSMAPPLTTLEREVSLVDTALQTKNLPHPPHYGLTIFVDSAQVLNGGMPYMDIEALKAELRSQVDKTTQDPPRQLNGDSDNLTWPEDALDGLYAAAAEFQWRPPGKTLRTIILITDASFWDLKDPSSGADSEVNAFSPNHVSKHSYDDTIAQLRMQMIWVNTFAAKTGGPPDGMMAPASHGQWRGISVDVGVGYFKPYKGKPSIADATGGLAWDIDDVFDMKISLATPINQSIEAHQCAVYPQ
jgi:hypothetical protein